MRLALVAAGIVAALVLAESAAAQGMVAAQENITRAVLARCAAVAEPFERAMNHCTTAIREGDLNETEIGLALFYRGIAAYRMKSYNVAMRDFNLSIEYGPEVGIRYYYKGLVFEAQGEDRRADGQYRNARFYAPDDPDILAKMAEREQS